MPCQLNAACEIKWVYCILEMIRFQSLKLELVGCFDWLWNPFCPHCDNNTKLFKKIVYNQIIFITISVGS